MKNLMQKKWFILLTVSLVVFLISIIVGTKLIKLNTKDENTQPLTYEEKKQSYMDSKNYSKKAKEAIEHEELENVESEEEKLEIITNKIKEENRTEEYKKYVKLSDEEEQNELK